MTAAVWGLWSSVQLEGLRRQVARFEKIVDLKPEASTIDRKEIEATVYRKLAEYNISEDTKYEEWLNRHSAGGCAPPDEVRAERIENRLKSLCAKSKHALREAQALADEGWTAVSDTYSMYQTGPIYSARRVESVAAEGYVSETEHERYLSDSWRGLVSHESEHVRYLSDRWQELDFHDSATVDSATVDSATVDSATVDLAKAIGALAQRSETQRAAADIAVPILLGNPRIAFGLLAELAMRYHIGVCHLLEWSCDATLAKKLHAQDLWDNCIRAEFQTVVYTPYIQGD